MSDSLSWKVNLNKAAVAGNKGNRGSSSVLVIMIMLTLVVFGLLVFMSSYSSLKLANKNGDWVKGYYALDTKAEMLTAQIDKCLKEAMMDNGSDSGYDNLSKNLYFTYAANYLQEKLGESVEINNHSEATVTVAATVTEGAGEDARSLFLELELKYNPPGSNDENKRYEILSWKELPREFEFDDSLDFEETKVE